MARTMVDWQTLAISLFGELIWALLDGSYRIVVIEGRWISLVLILGVLLPWIHAAVFLMRHLGGALLLAHIMVAPIRAFLAPSSS